MNRWMILGAIVLLAVIIGAARLASKDGVPVRATQLRRSAIRQYVDERGKTRLPTQFLISMPFAGRIEPITLVEGDQVSANQVVARIVSADLDDALAEAQAAVERLEASIAENADISVEQRAREQTEQFVHSMVATVKAADARLTAGQARLNYAETFLNRVRRLTIRDAETEDELDRAELSHVESQVEYTQDALVLEALKSLEAATNLLPRLVSDFIARKNLSGIVREKEKQEAEARLRQMLTRRDRGSMISPVDGVVLERCVSNEQFLPAGAELLKIGRLEELEVEAEVLSQDVVAIRAGHCAEIYGPAVGKDVGEGLLGKVYRIEPTGFTKISSLGVEQQRVRVIVRFDREVLRRLREGNVGVDYRVRVRIYTESNEDALVAPRSALFRNDQGGWSVFAVRGGRAQLTDVEVGLANDQFCEIASGLQENDLVILAPENSLSSGQKVQPQTTP